MALRDVGYVPVHIHVHQCRTRVLVPSRDYKAGWNYTLACACTCVYASARDAASRFLREGGRWAMTADPRANWTGPRGSSRSITADIRRAAATIRQLTGHGIIIHDSWNRDLVNLLRFRFTLCFFPSQEAALFQGRTWFRGFRFSAARRIERKVIGGEEKRGEEETGRGVSY